MRLVLATAPFSAEGTQWSTATQYVFHVANSSGFGAAGAEERSIVCQAYSGTEMECWVRAADGTVLDYVAGDATAATGITSESGDVRLFAGLRNDAFFFNLAGFNSARSAVIAAAPALTFDAAGCPAVDAPTSSALVGLLQSAEGGGAATDTFAGANVLAIVLEVDKSLLTRPGNEALAVWISSHRSPS